MGLVSGGKVMGEGKGGTKDSGYTDASAEMGLPIEGFMMEGKGEGKGATAREWMEEERGRITGQEWNPPERAVVR